MAFSEVLQSTRQTRQMSEADDIAKHNDVDREEDRQKAQNIQIVCQQLQNVYK